MNVWLELSRYLMIANSIVIYTIIFESRLSKRATVISISCLLAFVLGLNILSLETRGVQVMAQRLTLTSTLPSISFFMIISRHRDMRFLFTTCSSDVLNLWIVSITSLFHLVDAAWNYAAMFFARAILSAALDVYIFIRVRKNYQLAQNVLKKGWGVFTLICAGLYALLLASATYPTLIFERADELLTFALILAIVPLVLFSILYVIIRQLNDHLALSRRQVMDLQLDAMRRQLAGQVESEKRMRIIHHDMRHHANQIQSLLKTGDNAAALDVIGELGQRIEELTPQKFCENLTVNAMLSYYLQRAQAQGIKLRTRITIPEALRVDAVDLSTVLANALENACHANEALPKDERWLDVSCFITGGQMLIEIKNPYQGEVRFDESGFPLSAEKEHGIGSISIMAFVQKYQAISDYQSEGGVFRFHLLIDLPDVSNALITASNRR